MGRPKGSKNKKDDEMLAELEEMSLKTDDEVNEDAEKAKRHQKEDIVEVEFFNLEDPGLKVNFSFGPANRVKKYELWHGLKYKLPREVVRHLETRQTPIYKYTTTEVGKRKEFVGWKQRFSLRQVW